MELTALADRIGDSGLPGRSYSEGDLDAIASKRAASIPSWYRAVVSSYPIANLRYRLEGGDQSDQVDLVIPHPAEMLEHAEHHYLFADHSNKIFDDFRSVWFPFGVDADGSSSPLWLLRVDDESDRFVYQFHDDAWDPTLPSEPGNGAYSIGLTFEEVLTKATVVEHVTSDPLAPKVDDLRFEASMPALDSLRTSPPIVS